jgi:hypothetical protein
MELPDLMSMLREMTQHQYRTDEERQAATRKIDALASRVIDYKNRLGANEKSIFDIDTKLFEDLHRVFTEEINHRFERSALSRLLW